MMRVLPGMAVAPLLLALALPAAVVQSAICPANFTVVSGVGMTHAGHYQVSAAADAAACCSLCVADAAKCNAWTYHPGLGKTACGKYRSKSSVYCIYP